MDDDTGGPDIPPPEVLAGLLVLGCVHGDEAARVPVSAAWWIAEGLDDPDLIRLAGLSGDDTFEVRERLVEALEAMGIQPPSTAEACQIVFGYLAARASPVEIGERALVLDVERIYIDAGYSDVVRDQPLGQVYGFDDEWEGGWGRTGDQLVADVRSACRGQARASGISP